MPGRGIRLPLIRVGTFPAMVRVHEEEAPDVFHDEIPRSQLDREPSERHDALISRVFLRPYPASGEPLARGTPSQQVNPCVLKA